MIDEEVEVNEDTTKKQELSNDLWSKFLSEVHSDHKKQSQVVEEKSVSIKKNINVEAIDVKKKPIFNDSAESKPIEPIKVVEPQEIKKYN